MANTYYGNSPADYELWKECAPYHNEFQQMIAHMLSQRLPKKVPSAAPFKLIEIGCGTGLTTLPVSSIFPLENIIAVDIDAEMIAYSKQQLSRVTNVTWECMDALAFMRAQQAGSVDGVYTGYCIHNMTLAERLEFFYELGRILKPKAPVVIGDKVARDDVIAHWSDLKSQIDALTFFDDIERHDLRDLWTAHYLRDNANPMTETELRRLMQAAMLYDITYHGRWRTDVVVSATRYSFQSY